MPAGISRQHISNPPFSSPLSPSAARLHTLCGSFPGNQRLRGASQLAFTGPPLTHTHTLSLSSEPVITNRGSRRAGAPGLQCVQPPCWRRGAVLLLERQGPLQNERRQRAATSAASSTPKETAYAWLCCLHTPSAVEVLYIQYLTLSCLRGHMLRHVCEGLPAIVLWPTSIQLTPPSNSLHFPL